MNRIYKSIWNEQTGTYVAVSENVKAKGKRSGSSVLASAILAITVGVSAQAQTVTVGNGFNVEDLHKFSGDTITIAGAVGAPVTLITNNNVQVGSDVNLNTTGLVITGGPSVTQSGINAGNKKITNVAAGALNAGSTDAVNGAQLNATNQNVTTAQNAANAAQNTANKGLIVRANSGATDTLALGDTLTFVNGTNTTVAYDAASNTFRTNLNSNLTGLTGVNTASLNVTNNATVGGTLNVTGSSTLSGGANLGNKKITNLADGAVEAGSKDAVTGGQIFDQLFGDEAEGIKYFRVTSEKADAKAEGVDSIAIGPEANSEGVNSIAIGLKSEALANNSFAAGNDAVVTEEGESAIALGNGATAGGGAPGAGGTAAIAIGRDSAASGSSSVALGDASVASASKATALGADSQATAANAIAIGGGSANATGSFAAGLGATVAAGSNNSISLGTGAGAGINPGDADDRIDLIAIGTNAGRNVGGSQNIAIGAGSGSDVSGYFNLALGQNSGTGLGVGSDSVVSIGREANYNVGKTLQHAVAIGSYTKAATNAVSIGHQSDALAAGVAIGYAADAAENAVALGTNADAVSGSVALGLNSAASALDWAGASYLTNQATPGSVVSVGNRNEGGGDATLRRIVNVADGAATSDAATVGQLQKAQTEVAGLIGGGVSVNADGSFSDFTVKDKAGNSHTFGSVAEGFALLANGTIELLPATAVTFVSDTDKRIAGVAAGINNEDVVNVGQLKQELAANKVQYFHVNSSIDTNKVSNGAKGENAMAIGPDAVAEGDSSIALGHGVSTAAEQSIAIGNGVNATGVRSTVIGNSGTMATHEGGVAIGENAHSYGENSIVIGTGARSHLADSVVPNHNTVVIGTSAEATADNGTAIGMDAVATDERAVALGTTAQARGEDSMAFGSNAIATGVSSQASGTNANASGLNAQASGTGASASGYNAVATGTGAVGYATDGIAMGTGAVSGFSDPFNTDAERNTAGIAIGNQSLADQEHALALGVEAEARAKSSAAIGDNAEATAAAENGFAAGTNALVSAQNATAVGANTDATGVNASAFGNGAQATAGSALALGDGADAEGLNSTAMGTGANAQKANSMALGTNAIAYHEGSVALGSGSVTGTVNVTRTPEATVDGVKYDFAGAQPGVTSTVSVGSVGNERTISNVAAGQLNEKSTDAVNGSQLHATNKAVTALGNNLDTFGDSVAGALGGTSKYDPETHTVTAGLSVNGNDYSNVNDALQYVGQGWDVSGSGADKVNIGPGGAVDFKGDNNISVAQTGEKDAGVIAINLAKDVDLGADGSLTTGNTKVNNTGVTVGSGGFAPTTTVEAGKIVVTSAGGTGNNKSIVLDTSPTKAEITGLTNTTWNPAGTYNAGRAATEEQLKAVSDVAQNANQGWNVTTNADDATSENVAPGATVDFDNTDGNIVIGQTATNLTFDLADNLSVGGDGVDGKVGVKGADGKDGVSINPDAIVFHGIDGVDGKDGSLTMGKGEPGVDGVDGITRIQYTDPDGKDYEVATLNDGLNFAGDIGSISHKLNETVSLTGGVDDADKLSDDANIGVVAGSAGGLLLRLAKDLTGLTSATFSDGTNTTVVNGEGLTIDGGPSVTVDGIDGGDKQITGVASGLGGTKLADATGNILTNAANIGDLQSAANNLTNAGLNFVGNTGGAIHKDLGDTLSIGGGLADGAASTGANLRVDSDGSKLNLVMARNLTDLESITINNGGPVINAGGINMNGNKITGLEAGTADTDAVNVSQLKGVEETANKGWNVSSNDGGETKNVAPGATVDFDNTDGNIVIAQEGTDLTFDLADDIEIGNSITVGGTTNQTVINEGSVTTNNLTVDGRTQLGDNFIVSEDNSVTYNGAEIANLDDGLSFKGDDGTVVSRKLNETLDLTGGATGALSDNNIGVVADGTGALSIQLAKNIDLGADGSLTTGNTVVNNAGVKVAGVSPNDPSTSVEAGRIVVASSGGAGNNQSIVLNTTPTTAEITGLTNRDLNAADFATAGRAATEEQLQLVSENLTEEGLNFAGNTGDEIHKDLGETLRIAGGLDNAASASDANLRVDSENGELRIKLATSLTDLEEIQVGKDGVDGVDGTIGVNGKDGASVVLNGKDGSIGLTGPRGADGSDGASTNISVKDGAPGVDGADGTTTTRIVYTDPELGEQEVANLNDGLKFVGDDGNTVKRKLNQTLGLTGGAAAADLTGEGNIGVIQKDDGALSIQLAKDIDLTADGSLTTGDTVVNDKGLVVHDVTANPTATTRVEAGKIELFANPQGGSANTIVLDAEKGTIEGLSNRDLNAADFATAGRAATEEQLAIVNETANKGWNVTTNADDATSENVAPGATVDFDNTDDNIVIAQDKTSLTFDLAKNIKVDSINAGGTFLNSNGLSFVNGSGVQLPNTVFIKPDGIDMGGNKITKLAKGEISATSTDAVNGSQLSFLADSVKNIFGGDVSFDFENGTFTSPTYTINGKDYSTVQAAIDELAKGWSVTVSDPGGSNPGTDTGGNPGVGTPETGTGGPADILPGDQLTLVAGDNIDIVQKPKTDGNVGIEISVDPNLVVNSVTAGKTVMDDSGVKVGDNVHLGDTGLTVKGGPTGDLAFTADKVDVGGNKIQNVANGNIASGSKDAVNGGQIKDISQSVANALGGGSTVKNDGTVSAPSYTVGNKNEVVNNVGDAIDVLNQGWTLNAGGNNSQVQAGDKVSLLSNDGNIVITQVLGSAEVNFALNDTITVTEVNATTVNATTVNATTVNASTFQAGNTIVNNNGLSFVNNAGEQVGPSVSVTGINAGGSTITNVAAGVNDTDAVNVGQLKGVANNLTNQINSVRGDLKRVDRDARAGTASAAAMANLPQAYLPGKSMFAVSTAGHRGEQGFAAGLSTITDNGKWVLKGSVSGNSRGDVTYGAGVGYQW